MSYIVLTEYLVLLARNDV
ncbi:Protein of unknown function [Bacillus wiedmannii]|nr:Protein of unknown function [Bacillus wiedmannii]